MNLLSLPPVWSLQIVLTPDESRLLAAFLLGYLVTWLCQRVWRLLAQIDPERP